MNELRSKSLSQLVEGLSKYNAVICLYLVIFAALRCLSMFGNIRFVFHFPISRQGIDRMVCAGGLLMSESCDMLDFVTTAPDRPIKTALGFCSPSPYFFRKTLIFFILLILFSDELVLYFILNFLLITRI